MPYCTRCGTQEQPDQKFCAVCGTPVAGQPAGSGQLPYPPMNPWIEPVKSGFAGYWWRVLAFLIDAVLLAAAVEAPLKALNSGFYTNLAALTIVTFLYGTLMIAYARGQTLGMKVARIRVVNADDRGRVSLDQSVRRAALYGLLLLIGSLVHFQTYQHPTPQQAAEVLRHSAVLLAFAGPHVLDLLWPLWDNEKRTLHDRFAKTVVLRP